MLNLFTTLFRQPYYRRKKAAVITTVLLIILSLLASTLTTAQSLEWRPRGDGAAQLRTELSHHLLLTTEFTLLKFSGALYSVAVIESGGKKRQATVEQLVNAHDAVAGINANFFDNQGAPLGLIIAGGKQLHPLQSGGNVLTGIFQLSPRGLHILSRKSFTPAGVREAIQAGPRLLAKGVPVAGVKESPSTRTRSGVCLTQKNEIILYHAQSRFLGISLGSLLTFLTAPEIGCYDALNLDGGGSAQLYAAPLPDEAEISVPGRDEVPVILAIVKRAQKAS